MRDSIIVKHYSGSIAYGLNNENSDIDIRGIYVADPLRIRTPFYKDELVDKVKPYIKNNELIVPTEEDTKYFELNKYIGLLINSNPNAIESLYVDEKHIVKQTLGYQILRCCRRELLTRNIGYSFTGYAVKELKEMYKALLNSKAMSEENKILYVNGYKVKSAICIIRLLKYCIQLLIEGNLILDMSNDKDIKNLREGKWSLDRLTKWVTDTDNLIREELIHNSKLPKTTDIDNVAKMIIRIQDIVWNS